MRALAVEERANDALRRDAAEYQSRRTTQGQAVRLLCERCGRHLGWWHPTQTGYASWYCHDCKHHTERFTPAA